MAVTLDAGTALRIAELLDLFAELFAAARLLPRLSAVKPLTLDSKEGTEGDTTLHVNGTA